jgi:hypothetical protein
MTVAMVDFAASFVFAVSPPNDPVGTRGGAVGHQ